MKGIVLTTFGGMVIACLLALPALAGVHPNDRGGALGVGAIAATPALAVATQARPDGRELPDGADLVPVQPAPATVVNTSSGFDWGDAGIGLAGGVGLGLLLVAGLMTTQHIRRVSGAA